MQSTLQEYAGRIQQNEIEPVTYYDGKKSGMVLDSSSAATPLNCLSFGIYQLEQGPFCYHTGNNEVVLVPITATFEIVCGPHCFKGDRAGGPFVLLPGRSNASAVYMPRDAEFTMRGTGEIVLFAAPSSKTRIPRLVQPQDTAGESWGRDCWRRNVLKLVTTDAISTNLHVGETYMPPGFWAGIPPHTHDRDAVPEGQSDHEEVYYHCMRHAGRDWKSFGVQTLFDNAGLSKAYIIKDRTVVAIPGAAHSVVAGPVSDLLYIWGLAGKEGALAMRDVPEYAFLREVERALADLEGGQLCPPMTKQAFLQFCSARGLSDRAVFMLQSILKERGLV